MSKGGVRPGAGRPPKPEKEKRPRPQNQIRAYPEEWELIKEFAKIAKKDTERAKRILKTE